MEIRQVSWASTCPVTRSSHNWLKIKPIGEPAIATCQDCDAEWIGVEAEWTIYERGIAEWHYSKSLGGWARFGKIPGF